MTIDQADGKWQVIDREGKVLAEFQTNAEAWRYFDRAHNEPINRQEHLWNFLSRIRSGKGCDGMAEIDAGTRNIDGISRPLSCMLWPG
jgi:hypothetical protein